MNCAIDGTGFKQRYFMEPNHYLCTTAEGGVVLRLQDDQYIALSAAHMQVLSELVHGWPIMAKTRAANGADSAIAQELLQAKVLTEDGVLGKHATPISLPQATISFRDPSFQGRLDINFEHFRKLMRSSVTAALCLRVRSVMYAVNRVQTRKQKNLHSSDFDVNAAKTLVQIFYRLRSAFYTAKDHCLYDSLVLTEFLSHYNLYPTWVFGVRAFAPFAAHSWVQHEHCSLNWPADDLAKYTPILAV